MNVKMKLEGNKILTITEYEDENTAKLALEALKSNPQLINMTTAPGAEKLISCINVKQEVNKIIITTEFINEKVASCFYEINKVVSGYEERND